MSDSSNSSTASSFEMAALPSIVFVAPDGSERELALSEQGPRVNGLATHLRVHCRPGSAIGLMFPSSPDLVINWLACLHAGLRPLILQYPNVKQSHRYWADSVNNTIALVGLETMLVDSSETVASLEPGARIIAQAELDRCRDGNAGSAPLATFEILQLSSGTTGFRKAIAFDEAAVRKHVNDYNKVLGLNHSDVVVSWLPLYHDMGFIACFVMPLLLGVKVVMLDPVTWVRQPDLLFDAIERHAGTLCYMPNFGFEVMAGVGARALVSMRCWISCSEPISVNTATKFMQHVGAAPASFGCCYAMAENVFAVTLREGLHTRTVNSVEVVSCGAPIPGVEVKIVDGEVWVRSPASLRHYVGGQDIRDPEGFYPTGDLGALIDGELHISGRKLDLMIQAGRKFLLSDIDIRVNELLPDVKGRAATVAMQDERLGTEAACVLVESLDFFRRSDQSTLRQQLQAVTGVDQIRVEFVPPRFLTKTTSGKINRRKSLSDWRGAVDQRRVRAAGGPVDTVGELRATFPGVSWDAPVQTVLDSLSLTILNMLAADAGVEYRSDDTLAAISERISANREHRPTDSAAGEETIRVVSLAHRGLFDDLTEADLTRLGEMLGAPVSFEHVCLPPSAIVLSDLVFSDYFQSRIDQTHFAAVNSALNKLRGASVIIADDGAELFYPPELVYSVLSHKLVRDPRSDLISVRWQSYPQFHDLLPTTVVRGGDLDLADCSRSLDALADFLGTPIFRIANFAGFEEFTRDWDWRPLRGHLRALDPDAFIQAIGRWAIARAAPLRRGPAPALPLNLNDAPHYCSHATRKESIDLVLDHFDRFCIAGRTSSVPYIRNRLSVQGKSLVYAPSYAPEILQNLASPVDCLLICGSMGNFPISLPAVAVQHVAQDWRIRNFEPYGDKFAPLAVRGALEHAPVSGSDWFFEGELQWGRNRDIWVNVRTAAARGESA